MFKVKYFGMIAEMADCLEESFPSSEATKVNDLVDLVTEKYPRMANLSFKVALNNQLATADDRLGERDEIALLPPFAGG